MTESIFAFLAFLERSKFPRKVLTILCVHQLLNDLEISVS